MYYSIYTSDLKRKTDKSSKALAHWLALLWVTMIMALNLVVLIGTVLAFFVDIGFYFDSWDEGGTAKRGIVIVLFSLVGINYFIFTHKGKYKETEEKYKDEPLRKRRINGFLLYLYAIISFFLMVVPASIWRYLKFGVWF